MSEKKKPKEILIEQALRDEGKQGTSLRQAAGRQQEALLEEGELFPIVKQTRPKSFHVVRTFTNKYSLIERELFSTMLSKKERKFSEGDFCALMFAVAQKLYNDTYSTGRASKCNIGRAKKEGDAVIIDITLKEIIENGYGVSSTNEKHRAEITALLDYLHSTPLSVLDPEGTGERQYLLLKVGEKVKKYATQGYKLRVHNILCNLSKGYGVFPQDIMKRLVAEGGKNITSMDRRLLLHFGNQDQSKPHTDKIENLITIAGKWEEWKVQKKRVLKQLTEALERFIRVGILCHFTLDEASDSLTFYFKQSTLPKELLELLKKGAQETPSGTQ